MVLIKGAWVKDPRHAEALITFAWQRSGGTTIGLYMLGLGDREPCLAVSCPDQLLEQRIAERIAEQTGGGVEDATLLVHQILADPSISSWHLIPKARDFRSNSQSWGWQRTDPLTPTYSALKTVPEGHVAGTAIVFRSLYGGRAATAITAFCSGPHADEVAKDLAASYSWVGVIAVKPTLQRRWLRRCLATEVPLLLSFLRPDCVVKADELAAFWHPPIKANENEAIR